MNKVRGASIWMRERRRFKMALQGDVPVIGIVNRMTRARIGRSIVAGRSGPPYSDDITGVVYDAIGVALFTSIAG